MNLTLGESQGLTISMGNHGVSLEPNGPLVHGAVLGSILHFPIRSSERLLYKLIFGCAAYEAKGLPEEQGRLSLVRDAATSESSWRLVRFD